MTQDHSPHAYTGPLQREEFDKIILEMLMNRAPAYSEGENIPSRNGPPPGAIEDSIRGIPDAPNDENWQFPTTPSDKDT
jgi:hypothetical protein